MDYASPALPGIAPHMRPSQAQRLAQELDQESSIFDLPRYGTPVDLDVDLSHLAPSPLWGHEYIGRSRLGKERGNRGKTCGSPHLSWPGLSRLVPAIPIVWHGALLIEIAGTSPAMTGGSPTATLPARIAALPGASPKVPVRHLP